MGLEQFVNDMLPSHGLWAVFLLLLLSGVGIPLGEETINIPAGVLLAHGAFRFWPLVTVVYLGVTLADLLWFSLCRWFGTPLLHRRWFKRVVHPRRLLEVKHRLDRSGAWLVVMARFLPSSRSAVITVAGLFRMPYWQFALATFGCVLLTAPLQIGLGYLIGLGMGEMSTTKLLFRIVGLVVLILLVSALTGWLIRKRGTGRRLPRSRAAWLRAFRRLNPRVHLKAVREGKPDGVAPGPDGSTLPRGPSAR